MILLLDTSTPVCKLTLVNGDNQHFHTEWEANRDLADGLLEYIKSKLGEHGKKLRDVSGIGVFQGPGSFTGLRIGITVSNTLADSLQIPIIGAIGDDWRQTALDNLSNKKDDKIVLPEYGKVANITTPRK